ncbi:ATP-binding protein [Cupriavidus pinatubonensis]|uniref:histidine kinase n=1 Tax=Cupriavidus pinatubonensis TaxID=248026 RepID=A0ABN7YCC9_9BURK|nr:ATP-binding protein [Cupriavidus pinatubonensis]CAG9169837.1 Adaptive-response sensory-kinase SasA [Cupriavidus pinatubonensis]
MEADRIMSLVGGMVVERGIKLPLTHWLNDDEASEAFLQISILDEAGVLRTSTNPSFLPIDLSDREHFRIHVKRLKPALFVSKPLIGRVSGRWSVQLSKGIVTSSGRFLGVVVVSLDPLYLANIYKSVYLGKQGKINLIGTDDFVVRANWNDSETLPGQELPANSGIRQVIATSSEAVVMDKGATDGTEHIYGIRQLEGRNLAIVVGYGVDEALSNYRERLYVIIAIAIAFSSLVIVFQAKQVKAMRYLAAVADHEAAIKESLSEKKRHLRALFLAMPDGVAVFGRDGVIAEANTALCDLLSVSLGQLRGATQRDFLDWLYRGRDPSRQGCSAETLLWELNRPHPSGEFAALIEFDLPVSPAYDVRIVQAGNGSGTVLVLREVTDQLRHDRMKSYFVSMAAHELKAPLASIAGYADLLTAGIIPQGKRAELYHAIRSRVERLNLLLSDLLDLAQIEMRSIGDMVLHHEDVVNLVRETLAREFPGVARIRMTAATEPLPVMADRELLARAIRNLVENAIKYSEADTEVTVAVKVQAEGEVTVHVVDRGIGMTQDEARRAFDRFYRANRHDAAKGSGLGLSIVREIIALHHGQIVLKTQIGAGTTVSLRLPAAV